MKIEWLGFAGTALVAVAYLPQIYHLIRERCSAGISTRAYLMWGVASILLLSYAIGLEDAVFISLNSYSLVATTLIHIFGIKYRHSA